MQISMETQAAWQFVKLLLIFQKSSLYHNTGLFENYLLQGNFQIAIPWQHPIAEKQNEICFAYRAGSQSSQSCCRGCKHRRIG